MARGQLPLVLVLESRWAALGLALAGAALGLQPTLAGGRARLRRSAPPRPPQRRLELLPQPFQRQLAIPRLAAGVLGHGRDPLAGPLDDPLLLRVGQRRRRRHV